MNNKTLAVISYFTLIGWIIAFIMYNNSTEKSPSVAFHLKQSFGLAMFGIAAGIIGRILVSISLSLSIIYSILGIACFVLFIIGVINAASDKDKYLPLVGDFFDKQFNFIK